MTQQTIQRWHAMRTAETRHVEKVLRKEFPHTDAYRYNSASIRVRVTDSRFKGKSHAQRDGMVERLIDKLPQAIQADIITLLTLAPDEKKTPSTQFVLNAEFEDPTPSDL